MRVQPTARVSDWLLSVAEVLPLPHRAVPPYTLGEAVAELGDYAQAVGPLHWKSPQSKKNRVSLRNEIEAQSETLGERLGAFIASVLGDLLDDSDPAAVVATAARFNEAWQSEMAVTDAFRDLCDAARVPGMTSHGLRKMSAVIASQVGPAAHGAFSLLSHAADALVSNEEDLVRWRIAPLAEPLTEAHRLQMATSILVAAPAGRIIVWTVYYRAIVPRMREVAGPMTFLRADWALPNAFGSEMNDFPERTELRKIRKNVLWLDDLHLESLQPENRLAIVRVDLGERQVAGAVEEARRRVDAVLTSIFHDGPVWGWSAPVASGLF